MPTSIYIISLPQRMLPTKTLRLSSCALVCTNESIRRFISITTWLLLLLVVPTQTVSAAARWFVSLSIYIVWYVISYRYVLHNIYIYMFVYNYDHNYIYISCIVYIYICGNYKCHNMILIMFLMLATMCLIIEPCPETRCINWTVLTVRCRFLRCLQKAVDQSQRCWSQANITNITGDGYVGMSQNRIRINHFQ